MLLTGSIPMTTRFKSVDEYIASQPEAVQEALERVRNAIGRALPGVEEVISYAIPTCKVQGGAVLHFAGWKKHYSLYPATDGVIATFKEDLAPYEIRKRTLRFPVDKPVPVALIERIAKFRAKEVAEKAKTAAPTNQ